MSVWRWVFVLVFISLAVETADAQLRQQRNPDAPRVRARRVAEAINERDDIVPRQLNPTWEYLMSGATRFPLRANANAVFVPMLDGRVAALSLATGNLLWETPASTAFTIAPVLGQSVLYLALEREGGNGKEGLLRAHDAATGLTRWTAVLPATIRSVPVETGGKIYLALADGFLYALNATDGSRVWKSADHIAAAQPVTVTEAVAYVSDDAGRCLALDAGTGATLWAATLVGKPGRIGCDTERLYVGTDEAFLYALDGKTGRTVWRRRMGATIEAAPLAMGKRIYVASHDNFVYALNGRTGEQYWRQQMAGRLLTEIVELQPGVLAAGAFDTDEITLLEAAEGNIVSRLILTDGRRLFAGLQPAGDLLTIPTDRGVLATRPLTGNELGLKKDTPKKK